MLEVWQVMVRTPEDGWVEYARYAQEWIASQVVYRLSLTGQQGHYHLLRIVR